jgi:hypothetical protein
MEITKGQDKGGGKMMKRRQKGAEKDNCERKK